jgi:hypothetical protein
MGTLESILKSFNIRALDSFDNGFGCKTLGFYPLFVPLLVPREGGGEMVVWWACLAVLVGGGGEAKLALGRRYQSPFRQPQHPDYFAKIQFLEEIRNNRKCYKKRFWLRIPVPPTPRTDFDLYGNHKE